MKNIKVILTVLFITTNALCAQDSVFMPVDIKEFSNGKGLIVSRSYKIPYKRAVQTRFTPSPNQVYVAEKIMLHLLGMCVGAKTENYKGANEHLRDYYRQYLGYKDPDSGHDMLMIFMIRKRPLEDSQWFDAWANQIISGSGTFFEKNQHIFHVDLISGSFGPYSDGLIGVACECRNP